MDSIVTRIIDRFTSRAELGKKKYNTDLDRKDLNVLDWIQHLQDELHDAYLYSEKLKEEYLLLTADNIKQLVDAWMDETELGDAYMSGEDFKLSFYSFLVRNSKKPNS
jgi:hypothetical protein